MTEQDRQEFLISIQDLNIKDATQYMKNWIASYMTKNNTEALETARDLVKDINGQKIKELMKSKGLVKSGGVK